MSLCLTKHHVVKTYWGSRGIAPRIFNLSTRWRRVVSFTPRPFYPCSSTWILPVHNSFRGAVFLQSLDWTLRYQKSFWIRAHQWNEGEQLQISYCHGIRRFITIITKAWHLTASSGRPSLFHTCCCTSLFRFTVRGEPPRSGKWRAGIRLQPVDRDLLFLS
jgi:hypothetical protein